MNDNKESPLDRVERQLRERKEANGGLGTPSEAGNLRVLEQEIDWTDIDGRDKQAVLAREVDFSKMSRDELNAVYDAIAPDEIDERPARRLFDEANYARAVAEVERRPRTATVDFGIDSQEHYESLYYPIRNGEIAPSVLDAAMGHGAKLTELTRSAPSNPHKDLAFHTSWDVLLGRERGTGDGHRHLSPSEIIRCCKASPPAEPHRTADRDHADDNGRDR